MSSGCVLRKVNQLFTCEKNCNTVKARKALMKDFTNYIYTAETVYVNKIGESTEEQQKIAFILSKNQKDKEMNYIHGIALIKSGDGALKRLSWTGHFVKNKYKMKLIGENIEIEFDLFCEGNKKINLSIRKRVSQEYNESIGGGTMTATTTRTTIYDCQDMSGFESYADCPYDYDWSSACSNCAFCNSICADGTLATLDVTLCECYNDPNAPCISSTCYEPEPEPEPEPESEPESSS